MPGLRGCLGPEHMLLKSDMCVKNVSLVLPKPWLGVEGSRHY
jgi:hypothetical protein